MLTFINLHNYTIIMQVATVFILILTNNFISSPKQNQISVVLIKKRLIYIIY